MLTKWKSDFSTLLNPVAEQGNIHVDTTFLEGDNSGNIDNNIFHVFNRDIVLDEVLIALKEAKNGKAPGYDELPVEVLKNEASAKMLLRLFNICFKNGVIPEAWKKGIINPIPKSSTTDPRDPLGYRGITLAPSSYKLYCSVLNKRLCEWEEENNILHDMQNGFRKHRSTVDHISSLTSIIQTRKLQKRSTFTAFIDFKKAYDTIDRNLLFTKLHDIGIYGKMYQALLSIYKNVQCCVRVNNVCTEWFNVKFGLKQGCLLSPLLFNLYINDLANLLNSLSLGVDIDGENVCALLYADDLVLIASSEGDLQNLLHVLHTWTIENKMTVNLSKSKVVHFRPKCINKSRYVFKCGDDVMEIAENYVYLGLFLNEFLDYSFTASYIAKAAGRALGLLIAKVKAAGGLPFSVFTKLYDNTVFPVISYAASVWSVKTFSCIETIQNRACRFFLGVNRYAPNTAVAGDMGWTPSYIKLYASVLRHFYRVRNMGDERLNRRIFSWADRYKTRYKNWNFCIYNKLEKIGVERQLDTLSVREMISIVHDYDMQEFLTEWNEDLMRVNARRGNGGNKLRTYRKFKQVFETENLY